MIKVSAVVLHYKNIDVTRDCLSSLDELDTKGVDFNVLLVNNGTSDDLFKLKCKNPLEIIKNEENVGYAGGNNSGIRKALANGSSYIWILNNDTVVDKDCLLELIKVAESDKTIGVLGPKIYFAPGFEYHEDRYAKKDLGKVLWWAGGDIDWNNIFTTHRGINEVDSGQYDNSGEVSTVAGTAMLVNRKVFETIGLLDEKYYLYFEESDFCMRAARKGFKLWYVSQAIVWHKNAGSSSVGSTLHDYYLTRNRLLFGMRYAPLRSKIALLRESVKLTASGRDWQKAGVRDFFLGRLGKGSFTQ